MYNNCKDKADYFADFHLLLIILERNPCDKREITVFRVILLISTATVLTQAYHQGNISYFSVACTAYDI